MTFALTTRYTTPAERMRGCFAAESFEDAALLRRNGGEVVGAVPVLPGRGAVFPGTNGNYITYDVAGRLNKDQISILVEFWPTTVVGEYIYDATGGARYLCVRNAVGSLEFWMGGVQVIVIPLATYEDYWYWNKRNVLIIASETGNTSVYLNGYLIGNSAVAWTPTNPGTLYVGSQNAGTVTFNGRITKFQIYEALLTQQEAEDFYTGATYTYRNKAVLDLPMLMRDHDAVNARTLDRSGKGLHASFGAGAASPTKLARRGYEFTGGDYLEIAYDPRLKFETQGGIEVMCRFASLAAGTHLIACYGGASYTNGWLLSQDGDDIQAYFRTAGPTIAYANRLTIGKLYHVMMSIHDGVLDLIVDGDWFGSAAYGANVVNDYTTLFGSRPGPAWPMDGEILLAREFAFGPTRIQAADAYVQALAALQKV